MGRREREGIEDSFQISRLGKWILMSLAETEYIVSGGEAKITGR